MMTRGTGTHGLLSLVLLVVFTGCAVTPLSATRFSGGDPITPGEYSLRHGDPTGKTVQGYDVPGRKPGSRMPYEFFLGNAAHRLITYIYSVNHPMNRVYYNKVTLVDILQDARVGDIALLLRSELNLRPDITDISARFLFEIKPWNDQGLREGRDKARIYLTALNRAMPPGMIFSGGTDFQGEILIRFSQGRHIWRLEWRTTEPGVTQYRWTRSQEQFASEAAAYEAGQWVQLTEEDMRKYGGWVGQAVEGMIDRRERLNSFSGTVGVAIDIIGDVAVGAFSGAIFGRKGSSPKAQQPPARPSGQSGGKVIPFPARTPPSAPPAQRPAASGR